MPIALVFFPVAALLAVVALGALAPHLGPDRPVWPAIRTIALITCATTAVAIIWSH